QGDYLVAEADESDGSFLKLAPTIAVVTTVDAEHLDHYGTLGAIREAFVQFVNKVPFYGSAVLCLDQPNIQMLIPRIEKRIITYGLESGGDLVARRLSLSGMTSRFEVFQRGSLLGECTLQLPGRHNVLNALAAIGVGLELEIPFVTAQRALAGFAGVQRRFQIRGRVAGVTVVDDYGHRAVTYFGSDRARLVEHLCEITRPGDLVLTLGAGDVGSLGPELLKRLEADDLNGRAQC